MARRGTDRNRNKGNDPKGRVRRGRTKVCMFCVEHIPWIDYKDTNLLRRFMTDRGKIKARTNTGTCAQHQRDVAVAIKTARELAMLPYTVRTLAADKGGGRRGRGRSEDRAPTEAAATTGGETPDGQAETEPAEDEGSEA